MEYTEIIEKANEIDKKLGNIQYIPRRSLDLFVGKNILHFGSGNTKLENGNHDFFRKISKKIISIDNDPNASADYKNIDLIEPNCKFDAIISEHVFEHIRIEEIPDIVKKLTLHASEGAYFLMTLPNINNFGTWFSHYQHINFAPPSHMAAMIELCGWNTINRFGWSKDSHFLRHKDMYIKETPENNIKRLVSNFLFEEYNLQLYRYVSYIFQKN